jgi:hypothetical protein
LFADTGAVLYPPDTTLPPRNGYFLADPLLQTGSTWTTLTINTTNFAVSLPTGNPGNAQIYYYLSVYNSNTGVMSPLKNGVLKIFYSNDAVEPSVTDCGTCFNRYDTTSTNPNTMFGGIRFGATTINNVTYLQYQNITTYGGTNPNSLLYMNFRIERVTLQVP